jgi:hypothetical protein
MTSLLDVTPPVLSEAQRRDLHELVFDLEIPA